LVALVAMDVFFLWPLRSCASGSYTGVKASGRPFGAAGSKY